MSLFSCYCMVVDDIESIVHCNSKYICVGASFKLGIYRQQDQVCRIRSVQILNSSPYCMLLYHFFEKDTPRPCPPRPWCSCWRERRGKVDPGEHEHGGHWRRPAVFFKDGFPSMSLSLIVLEVALTGSDLWLTIMTKDNSSPWLGELRRGKKLISKESWRVKTTFVC